MPNWAEIEAEYITTGASYRALAEKYGIGESTIKTRSRKGEWRKKRQEMADRIAENSRKRTEKAALAKLEKLQRATDLAVDRTTEALEAMGVDGLPGGRDLKDIAQALKELTVLTREFYHIPTDTQAESLRIARERLELDRAKQGAEAGSGIQIVIGDGEWTG